MGFGILFLGYLITFIGAMTPVYAFTQIFGVLIMLYALSKLARHNTNFTITFWIAIGYLAASVYSMVGYFMQWKETDLLWQIDRYLGMAIVFLLHLFLLLAIRDISVSTGLPKLKARAMTNAITTAVYVLITVLPYFGLITDPTVVQYLRLASLLLGVLWLILNAALIFSCYMWICLEGDENMEKSPLNIPFLNTINDAMNRGIDKMAERRAEKNRDYIETRNNKKKK